MSWWVVLIVGFAVTLTLGVVEQEQRKAISNLQKGIDEIKRKLSELQRKVDELR
jgi:prefoldin subunit 5